MAPHNEENFSTGDALQQIDSDCASFSERMKTPRWYDCVLSVAAALVVAAPAPINAGGWNLVVLAVSLAISVSLVFIYRKSTGVSSTKPYGTRSWTVLIVVMALLIMCMVAAGALGGEGLTSGYSPRCSPPSSCSASAGRPTTASRLRSTTVSVSPAFHDEIHAPNRLRILSLLRPLEGAEFTAVQEALGLSDANRSKTIKTLAELQ